MAQTDFSLVRKYLEFANKSGEKIGRATNDSVGITEFATSKYPPISFKVDQHCHDFVVQEIHCDSKPLYIESQSIPPEEQTFLEQRGEKKRKWLEITRSCTVETDAKLALFSWLLSNEDLQLFTSIAVQKKNGDQKPCSVTLTKPYSKAERSRIHKAIRLLFPKLDSSCVVDETQLNKTNLNDMTSLVGNVLKKAKTDVPASVMDQIREKCDEITARKLIPVIEDIFSSESAPSIDQNNDETKRKIVVSAKTGESSQRNVLRDDDEWFRETGKPFLHFVLQKQNSTSSNMICSFAKRLKVNPKVFAFCGNKDKRALTTQKVSAKKITATRMLGVTRHHKHIKVGNFQYLPHALKLGDSQGNRFTLTLRGLDRQRKDDVQKACTELAERGYINYFGLQRFGTGHTPTHQLGKLILQGEWGTLIALLLFPKGDDLDPERNNGDKFREVLIKTDSFGGEAISACPRYMQLEQKIVRALSRSKSPKNAFLALNRQLRSIYVHAYQSYVWNHVASERIRKFGLEPIVGDLALKPRGSTKKADDVVLVTEEDVKEKRFCIFDVVLPLPCDQMRLPSNELEKSYHYLLEKDGVTLEMFKKAAKDRSLMIFPDYRPIVIKPSDLCLKFLEPGASVQDLSNARKFPDSFGIEEKVNSDDSLAVLSFTLDSSAYATMLLREVAK